MKTDAFTNCSSGIKLCLFYGGVSNTEDFMPNIIDT